MVQSFFGILPVVEADEAKAPRCAILSPHDTGAENLTKGLEELNKITVIELFSARGRRSVTSGAIAVTTSRLSLRREVLDIEVG